MDLISRQAAIEHIKKRLYETALNNIEISAYEDMAANRIDVWMNEVPSAEPKLAANLQSTCNQLATDCISRQAAVDALWKALFEYEDKTEKQFQKSEDLDVADWIQHRIFVQNMSDIDRQTILNLPSAQPETCEGCKHLGKWENEVEYGYPSPCTRCKRRVEDRYER